jgi:hypothetical protein
MLKIALLKCLHMFQIWFLVPKVFTSFCVVIYQAGALPAPLSEPSTPASIGSQEGHLTSLKNFFMTFIPC